MSWTITIYYYGERYSTFSFPTKEIAQAEFDRLDDLFILISGCTVDRQKESK